ncbi:MAG: DUF1993 domain-containing protein [Gammaproteobacteria bacterium]|nr:DUF1993 domain-containing protein [Gammaproteobacteria bacterium]
MTLSMYQASVPVFKTALRNLDAILARGVQHAEEHDIDPAVLLEARLFPDMFTLCRQVQVASDFALRGACRLAGQEPKSTADTETTFGELRARIATALDTLDSYRPEQIDGSEERVIHLKLPIGEMDFDGKHFLQYFVLPNLFFHVTTAYNILRHNGVPLGKTDFLGAK